MNRNILILFGFIIIKFVIQYNLISPEYELHRDEYLYLDQANHLDWGYLSVPPLISWISYLISLLGNNIFLVKFFPALFGALTIVVVWKTVEELKGNLFALILSATSVSCSAIFRINILYQPNSLDILLWTFFYFIVVKYINTGNYKWLYFASIAFALGFLNKYNIVFLLIGLLPALLLTKQRKVFKNKHFYYSLALSIILILPNFIWQYYKNFPVFHHLNELAKTQLENVNRVDFFKEQFLFFFGSIFVIVASLLSFFIYEPFKKFQLFFWAFLFTILVFVYFKAKGYYAIGLYPILLAFGAVYLEYLLNRSKKIYLRPIVVIIPIFLFIPLLKIIFPNISPLKIQQQLQLYKEFGLLRWEDGKEHKIPQDFADMLGWKEMANKVDKAFNSIPDKNNTLILCDNYGQAGAINFYSNIKTIQAVSFNADYINWFQLNNKISNVILVKEVTETDKNREKEEALFETVELFSEIQNEFSREKGTRIYILKNAKTDINKLIKKEIDKRKNYQKQ